MGNISLEGNYMTEETRYELILGSIKEQYNNLDNAIEDLLDIFPYAFFDGNWQSTTIETWMNIYVSCTNNIIIGKILEQDVN
jgi:hypothetical protein